MDTKLIISIEGCRNIAKSL